MEDSGIVDLYWERSEQAISETQSKYGHYCLSIARNILPTREDAQESVNDTYLAAWNAMPPSRPRVLSTFLGKLTRRISIDRWRILSAEKRGGGNTALALEELAECIPGSSDPEAEVEAKELASTIPVLLIGDLDARYHVLLQGAIHGREHMTAWLLMAMADYWLDHGIMGYGNVCYHIIPMANPDGVTISQTQSLSDAQHQIYLADQQNGFTTQDEATYASRWKANGQGVDINRNFSSGWESIDDRTGPSSERYQGTKPFSSAEAAALRDYTLRYSFDATVSYHTAGSIIYYEYGNKEPVNSESESLAEAVNRVSGYSLVNSTGIDGAGYKDWAMDELGIPSITVEIGAGETPLAFREIYSIFVRNYCVLPSIARWLQK